MDFHEQVLSMIIGTMYNKSSARTEHQEDKNLKESYQIFENAR